MTTYEHRVSERTLLVPGKVFKAREGPLIRMNDGSVESFADKGPFIFISREQNDDVVLIHAYDRNGFHSVFYTLKVIALLVSIRLSPVPMSLAKQLER